MNDRTRQRADLWKVGDATGTREPDLPAPYSGRPFRIREPARYRQACELIMMEQPRERVTFQLLSAGLSESDAAALAEEAWADTRGGRRKEGRGELLSGLGIAAGGIAWGTMLSMARGAFHVPLYVWGAIIIGGGLIMTGVRKMTS